MKKLLTAFLICTMAISLFGCNSEKRTNVSSETTENEVMTVAETTSAPKPEPEYITTNEYYSDLLSEADIKLLKENIVTMEVLLKVLGKTKYRTGKVIVPETYVYADVGMNNLYTKYTCKKYGEIYVTATSFYSKEIDDYVEYVYKCEYVDGIGGIDDQTYDIRVPLFYKRIAPPSNINFEGKEKPKLTKKNYIEIEKRKQGFSFDAKEFEEEYAFWRKGQDKFLSEEEQQFLRNNVVTIDTLEQVIGPMTFIGDFASGRRDEYYINERFESITIGGRYANIKLDDVNEINYYEYIYISDTDEQQIIKLYLPM